MFDAEARYAALDERVANQGHRLAQVEATMTRGFSDIASKLESFTNDYKNNQRPQWQAMGVMLTAALAIGALVYWPIREAQADLKGRMNELSSTAVSTSQFADFKAVYDLNRNYARQDNENRVATIMREAQARQAELQRQIDEVTKDIERIDRGVRYP